MMGHRQVEQAALFYEFSLERHVPADHLLRSVDRFVEFDELRRELAPFYSAIGRPSVDPELMIRMLIVGYCFGIRSERRLAGEQKLLMMRPYQIYAVKAIVDCITENCGNGYIWHTTGSGKTLTSFKASTLLKDNPDIEKCLCVSKIRFCNSGDGGRPGQAAR
jgi:hypothetical protein